MVLNVRTHLVAYAWVHDVSDSSRHPVAAYEPMHHVYRSTVGRALAWCTSSCTAHTQAFKRSERGKS